MKTVLGFAFAVLLAHQSVSAQQKIPVEVEHSGSDQVGALVAFELREAIRGSNGMRLIGSNLEPTIRVHLISTFTHDNDPGSSSAIAAVYVYDSLEMPQRGALLWSNVQVCGRIRAKDCARNFLAAADQQIVRLQEKAPALWKTLNRPEKQGK